VQCGDGKREASEDCDDGNGRNGDGCSSSCQLEVDWSCTVAGQECQRCGDGVLQANERRQEECDAVLDALEQCDDDNRISGDGCTSTCKHETGTCGNTQLESGEQCDDGNLVAGDGCNSSCRIEAGLCGDQTVGVGEQCDDGNMRSGDGCDAACRFEGCRDGVRVSTEDCDDGNRTDADGCDVMCYIELL
jgi:cysteine-rich repeat protein